MKIVTIIQARANSTRLPNKVLLSAVDKPLLLLMVERVQRAEYCGTIVVATTTDPADDIIEELCKKNNIECFRGHPTDLLDRHYKAAVRYEGDVILKIPSDCPLIDPKIIDRVISNYLDEINNLDYMSNLRPPTFPDGNDVEIMNFYTLEYIWQAAKLEYQREHTTPYIWDNQEKFRIGNFVWETGFDFSKSHRWTLDYEEDYTFIRIIFEELYSKNKNFGLSDILILLDKKPFISKINAQHAGKFWYNSTNVNSTKIGYNYL